MNCDTYLSMLETLPVEELAFGSAREHAAHCRDCDRVTRVVTERERNMLTAFGELYPPVPAGPIAARALVLSRRRRVASYYRIGLAVMTMAIVFFVIMSRRIVPGASARVSEAFRLQCLSPDQAIEMVRATTSAQDVAISARNNSVGMIYVVASPDEMVRVRSVLDRYDTQAESQCGAQLVLPRVIRVP